MDFYLDLDFDDWEDNLEDILGIVKDGKAACEVSRMQHEILLTDLKKRQDSAELAVTKIKNLSEAYKAEREKLLADAQASKQGALISGGIGLVGSVIGLGVLALTTGGVGLAVAGGLVATSGTAAGVMVGKGMASDKKTAEAVAKLANANIAEKAAILTQEELIPALASFIGGVQTCAKFFECTELELEKMFRLGDRGPKKIYFNMMRKNATRLSEDCKQFYGSLSDVRTNIAAIPEEPSDKNYVDQ